jgi:hypothetical protein
VIELGELVHDGLAEQRVYALVPPGDARALQLLPDTPAARQLLAAKPVHFWRAHAATGAHYALLITHACMPLLIPFMTSHDARRRGLA